MKLNEYQKLAMRTAVHHDYSESSFADEQSKDLMYYVYPLLGLNGETGELTDKIKKIIRNNKLRTAEQFEQFLKANPNKKIDLILEAGDVLWYLSETMRRIGVDLEEVAKANIMKLESRMARGVIASEGDNR